MKEKISYNYYGELVNLLFEKIKNLTIDCIFAPPRGGLPIATHLSHFLGDKPIIFEIKEGENILYVDDIVDTGNTLFEAKKKNPNIISCSIFYKTRSIIKPDYYVLETKNWIIFPWERDNEIPNRSF